MALPGEQMSVPPKAGADPQPQGLGILRNISQLAFCHPTTPMREEDESRGGHGLPGMLPVLPALPLMEREAQAL